MLTYIYEPAGLSSSLPEQLKEILDVVGKGLSRGNASQQKARERRAKQAELTAAKNKDRELIRERIEEGLWHDGRIDAVCGNGVMSELGIGIERFGEADADPRPHSAAGMDGETNEKNRETLNEETKKEEDVRQKQQRLEDLEVLESMPVVIIKNFESKGGGQRKEELLNVLAQWAASLAENQVRSPRGTGAGVLMANRLWLRSPM